MSCYSIKSTFGLRKLGNAPVRAWFQVCRCFNSSWKWSYSILGCSDVGIHLIYGPKIDYCYFRVSGHRFWARNLFQSVRTSQSSLPCRSQELNTLASGTSGFVLFLVSLSPTTSIILGSVYAIRTKHGGIWVYPWWAHPQLTPCWVTPHWIHRHEPG